MSRKAELNAERATGRAMQEINRRIAGDRERISELSGIVRPSDVGNIMQPTFQATTDITENQIASVYLESYYRECYEIQNKLGYYWRPRKMSESNVRAFINNKLAGENWKDRLQGHYVNYTQSISLIKTLGDMNGIPPDEVEDMIDKETGTVGECGLTYKIMRILRTESNHAVNRGSIAAYKQCGIKRYRVIAILDSRTCVFCHTERDGREYDVRRAKSGDTLPPFHPNCRCYTEPVIDEEARRKAQEKGTPGKKLSYAEWRRIYVDGDASASTNSQNNNSGTTRRSFKDITNEFLKNAKPNDGIATFEDGTDPKDQATAKWLLQKFGGNIRCLAERPQKGKMPDAVWRSNYWEFKTPTTKNAIDRRIRLANKQLAEALARDGDPNGERGILIDIKDIPNEREEVIQEIRRRAVERSKGPTVGIIKRGEEFVMAFRIT